MILKAPHKIWLFTLGLCLIIIIATWKTGLNAILTSSEFDIKKYENINYYLSANGTNRFSVPYNQLPATDYNRLIDINFSYPILNFVCGNVKPLLLILIHSDPRNYDKRKVIRETWGKNEDTVKILFMFGSTYSDIVMENIKKENLLHEDIIQGDFLDSYRNLTYKHTMAFKYVVYHCPQAKYILKTDDDIFVNMQLLKNFLTNDLSSFGASNVLMCYVIHNARCFRSFRSKWRVNFDEYPYQQYPTYCLGWTILYSPDVVYNLYREIQKSTYFWIDDVFITGIIAEKIHFGSHVDISPLTLSKREIRALSNDQNITPFLFGSADMSENEIKFLWNYVIKNPVPRSVMVEEQSPRN